MNWMSALLETYERCIKDPSAIVEKIPLLPIYHTLNNIHITVTIDGEGNILGAEAVPKGEQNTMIPCTEDSSERTRALSPHPLDDKLVYLAGDFNKYVKSDKEGEKDRAYEENENARAYQLYVAQLEEWCTSSNSNQKACAVLKYVKKGTLMEDLIKLKILAIGEEGQLLDSESCPDAPLYSISKVKKKQSEAFVRWSVDCENDVKKRTWEDSEISKSWISFVKSKDCDKGTCYVTGKITPLAKKHPHRIRNSRDQGKIISSNDEDGYTYRGRFENAEQACGVGCETSQKIHSALRWLIGRQGYHCGDLCIVSWTSNGNLVKSPSEDFSDILSLDDDVSAFTDQEAANRLNNCMHGYKEILDEDVFIIGLDSAQSGKGPISILFFRQELGREFVERIEKWHEEGSWIHKYAIIKDNDGKIHGGTFIGAPSPYEIANAAYGKRKKGPDKVRSNAVRKLSLCIIDGTDIPHDIVNSVVARACRPLSMEYYEWEKTLSIACSVYKKINRGLYKMTLEKERRTRDYLYGRLLAMADLLEGSALEKSGERTKNKGRQTTAVRLMQRFSEFPYSTWENIELALKPYAARLGPYSRYYESKISEIMDLFEGDDFRNNAKLSGEFLLAYHCQKREHYRKKDEKSNQDKEE